LIFGIWNYNDELQIKFYRYRTSYSYASVVDSWSYHIFYWNNICEPP